MPSDIVRTIPVDNCCCATPPPSCLYCSAKSGSPSLCGFSEFTSPSTPPKKYLKAVINVSRSSAAVHNAGTTCNAGAAFCVASKTTDIGTIELSSSTCAPTTYATKTVYRQPDPAVCGLVVDYTDGVGTLPSMNCSGSPTQTQTTSTDTFSSSTPLFCGDGSAAGTSTDDCSADATLSVEDTDANAVARFQAATAWGDPSNTADCIAKYQQRVSGFSFAFTDVQWTIFAPAVYTPGATYSFSVEYWRRPYGGGPGDWVHHSTLSATATADGTGLLYTLVPVLVPNVQGYETQARCNCVFTLVP